MVHPPSRTMRGKGGLFVREKERYEQKSKNNGAGASSSDSRPVGHAGRRRRWERERPCSHLCRGNEVAAHADTDGGVHIYTASDTDAQAETDAGPDAVVNRGAGTE